MIRAFLIASLLVTGCAGAQPHTLGTSAIFRVVEQGADAGQLERLSVLKLPENATVSFEPVWFVGRIRDMLPDLRPQIIVRAVLDDGGVIRWAPHDGRTPLPGRWNPQQRYKLALGGVVAGPIRVRGLARLEILVADLDGVPASGRPGASSLITPTSEGWAAAEAEARALGADLELVAQIAIRPDREAPIGERLLHLAVVEAEPHPLQGDLGDAEDRLSRSSRLMRTVRDGDPAIADRNGRAMGNMSALTLRLRITVHDHVTRPPPGENQQEKREEDQDPDRWLRQAPPRRISAHTHPHHGRL